MLLNHYGGARAALDALPELARRGGAHEPARICPLEDAERELAASRRLGIALIAIGEPDYPPRLRAIDDAPPLLGVRGKAAGAGAADGRAGRFAQRFGAPASSSPSGIARELGEAGFVIVSGLARGIDAAAHRASVATGTVAVLAGGHDHIYPAEHAGLLEAILPNGAAVSEMPLGWEPRGRDFPRRNRLISGLSLGVVIVEAARRSGSLITARMALEQGREVFAVPGSPLDPRAEGTNGLLKQGATLVTEAADVLAVLQPILGQRPICRRRSRRPSRPPLSEPAGDERDPHRRLLGPDAGQHRRPGAAVAIIASHRAHGAAGARDRRPAGAARRRAGVAAVELSTVAIAGDVCGRAGRCRGYSRAIGLPAIRVRPHGLVRYHIRIDRVHSINSQWLY